MKHDPVLFDARTLHNDTRLLFKLKLLLGTVCAYGGEVPLTTPEIAKRLGTSGYRVRTLLQKLVHEGVVHYDDYGRLIFDRYKFIQQKEEYTDDDRYAKCFSFFTCDEFLSEERNVQRFVLHYVGNELAYLPNHTPWVNLEELYGDYGILNIRTRKEAIKIVEKAKKYLRIMDYPNSFKVLGVEKKWLDMGEVYSEGAELWVLQQLKKHRFCYDFLSRKAIWQIAKVMEDYYAKYLEHDYRLATEIFDFALYRIQKDRLASHTFLSMIYRSDEEYIVSEGVNELDQISAYFRKVMENAELDYAKEKGIDLDAINNKIRNAERRLFNQDGELMKENEQVIEDALRQRDVIRKQLLDLQRCWIKRFEDKPDWFIENHHHIMALPDPVYDIQQKIRKYIKAKERSRFPWAI